MRDDAVLRRALPLGRGLGPSTPRGHQVRCRPGKVRPSETYILPLSYLLGITGGSTPKSAGKAGHASTSGSLTKPCDEAVYAATPGSTGRLRSSCAIGYYYMWPRQWTGVYASSLHSNLLQR